MQPNTKIPQNRKDFTGLFRPINKTTRTDKYKNWVYLSVLLGGKFEVKFV